jgi:tetratricopeptide (TPR) repeat protein
VLNRLAPRDAILAEGGIIDFADRDANGVRLLREFVGRYPDEAEGWYQLSDFLFHLNQIRGGKRDEIIGGFDKAVELGPRFAPYYIHAIDGALLRGDSARTRELLARYRALAGEGERWREWTLAESIVFGSHAEWLANAARDTVMPRVIRLLVPRSDRPQVIADASERYLAAGDQTRILASLRAGRWNAVRRAFRELPPATRAMIEPMALRWVGAFGLRRDDAALILDRPSTLPEPDFWNSDAKGAVSRMMAARDNGTGADPLLLAHMAERSGDVALAATLFEEESWRELGPAALFRLAKIHEAAGRSDAAMQTYQRFLAMWSGADPQLSPVVAAREALRRLSR